MDGNNNNSRIVLKLTITALLMFGFGFALVPLYDVFCEVTGINGKTENESYQGKTFEKDGSRQIKVQFIARNNDAMPWFFNPTEKTLTVNPGESILTYFYAKNPTLEHMVAQAIPSVSPGRAANYFHKTACFCFEQQPLSGLDSIKMPLIFVVDPDLPKDIKTITLAYTLYDITDKAAIAPDNKAKVSMSSRDNDFLTRRD